MTRSKNRWKPLGRCTDFELFEEVDRRIAEVNRRIAEAGKVTDTRTDGTGELSTLGGGQ